MNYLVFHIVGYNSKISDIEFTDKLVVRLIDESYEKALERAKNIVDRNFWFLAEVVEYKENK
jgi:hypothetical protein